MAAAGALSAVVATASAAAGALCPPGREQAASDIRAKTARVLFTEDLTV
jgi:hypothetical protein